MKNLKFLIIIFVFLLSSCSKEESIIVGTDLVNSLNEFGAQYYQGETQIIETGSKEVVVLIKQNLDIKSFVLQKNEELNVKITDINSIIYTGSSLILFHDGGNKIYHLGIDNNERDRINEHLKNKRYDVVEISGYGMSNNNGLSHIKNINLLENYSFFDVLANKIDKNGRVLDDECDSGGPGSSSCSQTQGAESCNVECNEGYYACCNANFGEPPSCKCERSLAPPN